MCKLETKKFCVENSDHKLNKLKLEIRNLCVETKTIKTCTPKFVLLEDHYVYIYLFQH